MFEKIFTYTPAIPCGQNHEGQEVKFLSCPCSLAAAGCYMIVWDGPGLGLVCDDEEDAKRKAHAMNVAWNLAKYND